MANSRRGRPAGPSDTRERLVRAGQELFLTHGYAGTTVREIARAAGVDHAMVNYCFGSKEGLLRAVLDMVVAPGEVFDRVRAAAPGDLATALLTTALGLWDRDEIAEGFRRIVLEAATGGPGEAVVREYLGGRLAGRIEEAIGGRDARGRTAAVAAIMAGTFMTRYVLRIEPIAGMSRDEAVRACAPALGAALGR